MGGEAAVVVGAQRDHDNPTTCRVGGRAGERAREGEPLVLGAAGGEELLELVDGEKEASVRRQRVESLGEGIPRPRDEQAPELVHGPLAGAQQETPPAFAARQDSSRERRQETGTEDRRLAAARRADDSEEAAADEPGDELRDESLAAEEVLRVDRLEAREPLERADAVGSDTGGGRRAGEGLRLLACELQVDDAAGELGLDLAEPASAGGGTRGGVDEPAGRLVDRDGQR